MHSPSPWPVTGFARSLLGAFIVLCWFGAAGAQADIARFVGDYSGSAQVLEPDGGTVPRDLSVSIRVTKKGFAVRWTTVIHRPGGASKQSTYDIDFVPSARPGVFAAAMRKNVFGHAVQLDPMKGEPYVWARITGDTLTVYSLFVDADGGYELQQFDRSLAPGGLELEFNRISDGERKRTIRAHLQRLG